jgi:hypothetical protein
MAAINGLPPDIPWKIRIPRLDSPRPSRIRGIAWKIRRRGADFPCLAGGFSLLAGFSTAAAL